MAGRFVMSILFDKSKKPSLPALTNAANYAYSVARGVTLPAHAVFCPILPLTKYVTSHSKWKKIYCLADIYVLENQNLCYITNYGMGAPVLALVTELAVALGVKKAVYLGLAGSLQEEVQAADAVLCNESLCDDGTSPCYVSTPTCKPASALLKKWTQLLQCNKQDFHIGRNWTTDAIFRETKAEITHYKRQAVLTVEMETSAFYAVCKKRRVQAAAAFVISDTLVKNSWQRSFDKRIFRQLEQLFESTKMLFK